MGSLGFSRASIRLASIRYTDLRIRYTDLRKGSCNGSYPPENVLDLAGPV